MREGALDTLEKLRQATYVAEMTAGLPDGRRIDHAEPWDLHAVPTLRPRTPARKAKDRRKAKYG